MSIFAEIAITVTLIASVCAAFKHLAAKRWIEGVTNVMVEGCHNISNDEAPRLARRFARFWQHREQDHTQAAIIIAGDQLLLERHFEAWAYFMDFGEFPEWY